MLGHDSSSHAVRRVVTNAEGEVISDYLVADFTGIGVFLNNDDRKTLTIDIYIQKHALNNELND
jgi:hypothetical protein